MAALFTPATSSPSEVNVELFGALAWAELAEGFGGRRVSVLGLKLWRHLVRGAAAIAVKAEGILHAIFWGDAVA